MYNVINPAVAKSIMLRMDIFQLQTEIAFFEQELETLKSGNLRKMYLNLRAFAQRRLKSLTSKSESYEFEF
jgi:hypothetical protein